eukprot:11654100-Ditylum_brightwellii.AAC.1
MGFGILICGVSGMAENPEKKLLLVAIGHEGELHLDVLPDADKCSWVGHGGKGEDRHGDGSAGAGAGALGVGHGDQEWAVYTKVSANECHIIDVQNTQQQHYHSISCRLGLIEKNK